MDDKQPLWLPQGSVRAIIALGLVAAFVFGKIGPEIIAAVIGFYFGSKAVPPPV